MHGLAEEIQGLGPLANFARVAVLIVLGIAMEIAVRVFVPRWTARISTSGSRAQNVERQQRSATVVNFSSGVVRLVIWALIFVSVLSEININIGPLLAGAGVLGAALAFGAQNIIRDYLAGIFILLENQFTLGDVIKIGALSGTVEEITMRITVLRAVDGAVHVIPNGTIQAVSNLTRGWARTLVDINIAYGSNIESALAVLARVASDFHKEKPWDQYLIEPPEVFGVTAITEVAVSLRMGAKVVAGEQWKVQRELLRRLKNELDAQKIAPPPPGGSPLPRPEMG